MTDRNFSFFAAVHEGLHGTFRKCGSNEQCPLSGLTEKTFSSSRFVQSEPKRSFLLTAKRSYHPANRVEARSGAIARRPDLPSVTARV
jgi:hypothetical protein